MLPFLENFHLKRQYLVEMSNSKEKNELVKFQACRWEKQSGRRIIKYPNLLETATTSSFFC